MTKRSAVVLLVICFSLPLLARIDAACRVEPNANGQGGMANQGHESFKQKLSQALASLNLTDTQKQQIAAIEASTEAQVRQIHEQMKAIDETTSGTDAQCEQLRNELKTLHKQTMQQILQVLTPEQRKQLENLLHPGGANSTGAGANARRFEPRFGAGGTGTHAGVGGTHGVRGGAGTRNARTHRSTPL